MRKAAKIALSATFITALSAIGACSVLTSFSDLTGDASDAAINRDASVLDATPIDASANADAGSADANVDAGYVSLYRAAVLSDSPVSYLRMDDDAGAMTAHDETGNYAPQINGNVTFGVAGALAGDDDTAMSFDGTSATIDYGEAPFQFIGNSAFSLEAWANTNLLDASYRFVFSKNDFANAAGRQEYGIFFHAADGVNFERYVNGDSIVVGTGASINVWMYIVAVYDGSSSSLYVNGVLAKKQANTESAVTINGDLCVGDQDNSGDGPFSGVLDEIAIYDKALTATQIAHHYAVGTGH